ncbi:MAG: hypothetical protein ACTHOF_01255 [Flavisolibacter sp.]
MRLKSLYITCLVLLASNCYSQSKSIDTVAVRKLLMASADSMGELFVRGEIKEYVHYVHPIIVKAMGGEDKMVRYLDSMIKSLKAQGFEFKDVRIGMESALFSANKELQACVSQIQELKVPKGRLIVTSYLIAISDDAGRNWHFIDTGNYSLTTLRKLLPSLNRQMVVPDRQQPIFYPE